MERFGRRANSSVMLEGPYLHSLVEAQFFLFGGLLDGIVERNHERQKEHAGENVRQEIPVDIERERLRGEAGGIRLDDEVREERVCGRLGSPLENEGVHDVSLVGGEVRTDVRACAVAEFLKRMAEVPGQVEIALEFREIGPLGVIVERIHRRVEEVRRVQTERVVVVGPGTVPGDGEGEHGDVRAQAVAALTTSEASVSHMCLNNGGGTHTAACFGPLVALSELLYGRFRCSSWARRILRA